MLIYNTLQYKLYTFPPSVWKFRYIRNNFLLHRSPENLVEKSTPFIRFLAFARQSMHSLATDPSRIYDRAGIIRRARDGLLLLQVQQRPELPRPCLRQQYALRHVPE